MPDVGSLEMSAAYNCLLIPPQQKHLRAAYLRSTSVVIIILLKKINLDSSKFFSSLLSILVYFHCQFLASWLQKL